MKSLVFLAVLALPLAADPISVGPIPLTGFGSFGWNIGFGNHYGVVADGTNGTDTVSMMISDAPEQAPSTQFSGIPSAIRTLGPCPDGGLSIDSIPSLGCATGGGFGYSFGNGSGIVYIYRAECPGVACPKTVIIQASVIAYINITSYQETYFQFLDGVPRLVQVDGTFTITPEAIPEPATWLLTAVPLLGLALWQRRSNRLS